MLKQIWNAIRGRTPVVRWVTNTGRKHHRETLKYLLVIDESGNAMLFTPAAVDEAAERARHQPEDVR